MSDVRPIRRALLAPFDKTGLPAFAGALVETGAALVSSGGTAKVLAEAGLPVTPVESPVVEKADTHSKSALDSPRSFDATRIRVATTTALRAMTATVSACRSVAAGMARSKAVTSRSLRSSAQTIRNRIAKMRSRGSLGSLNAS